MKKLNKILVVDDDMMNLDVLWEILSDSYEVKLVDSGVKAIDSLKTFNPDLILLDIMMPIMDGYETAERIKADPNLSDIPIIFVTALSDMENKIKGFKIGVSDYITKPFEYDEIIARVETHIRLKKAMEMINKYNDELEEMLEIRTKELIDTEKKAAFSLVIAGIIHNLKGPLSGILGGADLLSINFGKLDISEKEMARLNSFLEIIKTGVSKLDTMINSMMIKAKTSETSDIEVKDLNLLIERELSFWEANLEFKSRVTKEINLFDQEELLVEIIPSEIVQVFQNLLSNAIEAMWNKKEKHIVITTNKTEDNMVYFSIKDSGGGIPKEHLNKVFDPFFTTKKRDDSDNEFNEPIGTGLGLYSAYQIINKNNGSIDIHTNETGTEFVIKLPRYKS